MPRSRTAPPIRVEVRRSRWQLACVVLLFLMALAIAPPLSLLLFFIPLIAWYRSPIGILEWNGATWLWNEVPMQTLVLQLDWQYGMVVSGLWLDSPSIELRRAIVQGGDVQHSTFNAQSAPQ
ncbi:MAG: hypothetical protein RIR79_2020 [Pseudomonadota bacterium]